MSNAQSSAKAEPQWAAFVAVDWGDEKHYGKLRNVETQQEEEGELKNTPEEFDRWAIGLGERFGQRPIAVCLEQARGAVIYQLMKYGYFTLYPVHSTTAARFRETFYPSGAKSDAQDAASLLELLLHHRGKLRRLDPDTTQTRELQMLVEQRRTFVGEKTAWSNRLTGWLKRYFPQVLHWIDDIDSPLGCDLLDRWPTLEQLQHAHPGTLHKFFLEHNSRSEERIQERIRLIYAAIPATRDEAILTAGPLIVRQIVAVIRPLHASIEELDQRIQEAVARHPETALFSNLPGAGPVLLPRLIVAFGTKRDRYGCADDLEAYSGIAPVTSQSGHSMQVHFRWSCPKFLRQTFHEFAGHTIARCAWARAFYQMKREAGKDHHAAVRALAFKWIRVLYACWRDGRPYDEQTYLRSLQKRSPLARVLATQLKWESVSGFSKLSAQNS